MIQFKVNLIISNLAGGGAEGVCITIANGLFNLGHDVQLIVLNENKIDIKSRLNENIKYKVLNVSRARHSFISLYRTLKNETNSVVISFDFEVSITLLLLKKHVLKSLKIVVRNVNTISSDFFYNNGIFKKIYGKIYLNYLNSANYVICQSCAMQEDLLKYKPLLYQKSVVIYNPLKLKSNNYKGGRLENINQKYILYAGRIEPQKSLTYLISAFEKLNSRLPEIKLLIVGDGSQKNSIINLVKSKNISDNVLFLDFTQEVENLIVNALFTVLTSQYEGLPNILIESISYGTPVLSFDCPGGIKEIIIQDVNGKIVPLNNIEVLSNDMFEMINKFWNRQQIKDSSNKFNTNDIIKKYIDLLMKI